MKSKFTIMLVLLLAISSFAQNYPEVTIRDINFVPDSALIESGQSGTEPKPILDGDTVIVTGVLMNSPYFNANPQNGVMLAASAPSAFFQDTANTAWSGVLLRYPNLPVPEAYANLDSGLIIKATAKVVEYFTTTELDLISFEASDIIGFIKRPEPVLLTLDSFFVKGTSTPNYLAEKWEGVYVEFRDLITSDPGVVASGTFKVFDENNTSMVIYNKGNYIRNGFVPPTPGTKVSSIKGFIETRTGGFYGWFMLNPVYPSDIVFGESAPNISNVIRDKGIVKFGEEVTVSAKVVDADRTSGISKVQLHYSVNEKNFVSVDMPITDLVDSIWSAIIPAFNDSSLVRYYITAVDSNNFSSRNPTNNENYYFYMVLNRDLTIKDIQYSPFGSGFSGYNGYYVQNISGRISADTSDIQGDGANIGPQVYMQNGTGVWSGIQIFGTDAFGLSKGTLAGVSGIVNESFGVTRIGTLDQGAEITVFPVVDSLEVEPFLISTADIGISINGALPAESFEGVLVKLENVKVIDENADGDEGPDQGSGGNRNFGEMLIADDSNVQMRIEMQDGTHDYHNFWDAALENKGIRVQTGHKFESITGILFYSFNNYKLVPRKNDDFVGHITEVNESIEIPEVYSLSQNYPNPFNPSTIINYSIPNVASSFSSSVTLKIYDVLGREIKTLVNKVQSPGNYKVEFNASGLTSGIYFYTLKADNFYQTKKMILIR